MSHHLHTNTAQDIEISMLEPFLTFTPNRRKPVWQRLAALYWPVVYTFVGLVLAFKEIVASLFHVQGKTLDRSHLIGFALPLWMYWASGAGAAWTLFSWALLVSTAGFFFMVFGLTAGHHSDRNFFDGDVPREDHIDWGVHQLDTVVERVETCGNVLKSITTFGDHALHHLFPTLDHAELKYLYPTFLTHCEKYETELRTTTFFSALLSNSKQLMRNWPNSFRDKKRKGQCI